MAVIGRTISRFFADIFSQIVSQRGLFWHSFGTMMFSEKMGPPEHADAELVAQAQRGDRDAFGRIVARYQALICALAYNATGSVAQSEDLAQESFVVAWKQLPALREPEKLRSWLCGIVRNLGRRHRRDEKFEPVRRAEPLETVDFSLASPEPNPLDQAISREEEGILWRQLEAIPESYREPLILFYREHTSIERVALALDLSEDAVRQRLTRGRKLLQEQVLAFVETALTRTSPKPAFTQQVLAALPAAAASSGKAAGAALAAASGSAAKGAWAAAGPLGGMFALLGGAWVTWRASDRAATKSPREQRFVARMAGIGVAFQTAFYALALLALEGGFRILRSPLARDIEISAGIFLFWMIFRLSLFQVRRQFQIRHEDKTFDETEWRLWRTGSDWMTGSAPSFWLLLKRSALPFFFLAIFAVHTREWRTPLTLGFSFGLTLLVVFLSWSFCRLFFRSKFVKNRLRNRKPRLVPNRKAHDGFSVVVAGLPIALTFLAIYTIPPVRAWNRSLSIREFVLLDAAVILAYVLATGIFHWKGRSIPPCD